VRTRQEEGSEKTQPDVGALQRQIQELLNERQQSMERDEKTRQELANYQATIGRMREELQGLRRTVAGTGFSLARLRNEMDTKRRANEKLEHRNHSLRKELRRAGQRLLDLGKLHRRTDARGRRELMSQIVTKQGRFYMTHTSESEGMLDFTLWRRLTYRFHMTTHSRVIVIL